MIINIHGLASSGDNSKFAWLKANVPGREIYSPTFDYTLQTPRSVLDTLIGHASGAEYVLGSSLGGFFAALLNRIFPRLVTVLINPAFVPFLSLGSVDGLPVGMCKRYHELFGLYYYENSDSYYEKRGQDNLHVLLGSDDDLLRHDVITKPLLPDRCRVYDIAHGTHRLEFTPEVNGILRSIFR